MHLLLDTHAMLWFFWDDSRLSRDAKSLIEDADNRKLVSILAPVTGLRVRSPRHPLITRV